MLPSLDKYQYWFMYLKWLTNKFPFLTVLWCQSGNNIWRWWDIPRTPAITWFRSRTVDPSKLSSIILKHLHWYISPQIVQYRCCIQALNCWILNLVSCRNPLNPKFKFEKSSRLIVFLRPFWISVWICDSFFINWSFLTCLSWHENTVSQSSCCSQQYPAHTGCLSILYDWCPVKIMHTSVVIQVLFKSYSSSIKVLFKSSPIQVLCKSYSTFQYFK